MKGIINELLGCIARTSTGAFQAARSMTMVTRAEPVVAEALAALYAIGFGRELGFQRVILVRDAQTIVKEVNREGLCTNSYGHFVEGIQSEMRAFETAQFIHVNKEANNIAHRLAKLAITHVINATWLHLPMS